MKIPNIYVECGPIKIHPGGWLNLWIVGGVMIDGSKACVPSNVFGSMILTFLAIEDLK